MVWNVLWMAAMAAASVVAGFCMGRLSGNMGDFYEEDDRGDQNIRHRGIWEVEAAGELNVQMDGSEWDAGDEDRWIRMSERADRGLEVESRQNGTTGLWGGQRRIGGSELPYRSVNSRFLRSGKRIYRGRDQQQPEGQSWSVGSPVSGLVSSYREGEHPGVVIYPGEDKLYAPAGGKITRLFPMGNAFLFKTEFGTELYIQAGDVKDDLLGRYFRPRIVQNEIVSKGKLLLEFDRQGLEAEGVSAAVTVSVESRAYGSSVAMTAEEKVRSGEEILRVRESA